MQDQYTESLTPLGAGVVLELCQLRVGTPLSVALCILTSYDFLQWSPLQKEASLIRVELHLPVVIRISIWNAIRDDTGLESGNSRLYMAAAAIGSWLGV